MKSSLHGVIILILENPKDMIVDGGISTFDAPNKGWMADVCHTPVRVRV